jgi:general stress protein 26
MQTTDSKLKDVAYEFINKHRAAALATVDDKGTPHVAPIFCLARKDLGIYFSTRVEGRKFINLVKHPTVAMTLIDKENVAAIQLTGLAERLDDLNLEQSILYDLATLRYQDPNWTMPAMKLFEKGATNEIAIIRVTPSEMTYSNFTTQITGKYKPFFQKVI